jgi:hypothetical protein
MEGSSHTMVIRKGSLPINARGIFYRLDPNSKQLHNETWGLEEVLFPPMALRRPVIRLGQIVEDESIGIAKSYVPMTPLRLIRDVIVHRHCPLV